VNDTLPVAHKVLTKMKYIRHIILFSILGSLVFYVNIFNNKLEINVLGNATKSKIKIEHGISANTINRENDQDLFEDREKYDVIFDGIFKARIKNEYGENDFLITYNDEFYFSFRHFKTNWHHRHKYQFTIDKKSNNLFVEVKIIGEDQLKINGQMIPINQANKHLGNTLINNY